MKHKKILVVDDDDMTREIICYKLKEAGYELTSASQCIEALTHIRNDKPDLVLLDIIMPGLSGLEILNLIRADDILLPVILMSRLDNLDIIKAAGKLGATDYIVKPFDSELLLQRMKNISGFSD